MKKYNFGQRVIVTAVLKRETTLSTRDRGYRDRVWVSHPLKAPRGGIFLGLRNLNDGHYWQEDRSYLEQHYFTAALVIFSERENPVYVNMDSINPL